MKKRSGQLWIGVTLLILGILFLLRNFGLVTGSVWGIIGKFWPLILVFIGLEMIVKDRIARGVIIVIFLILSILVVIFSPRKVKSFEKHRKIVIKNEVLYDTSATFILNEDLKGIETIKVKVENIKDLDITVRQSDEGKLESELYIGGKRGEFFADSVEYTYQRMGDEGILRIRDMRSGLEGIKRFLAEKGYKGHLSLRVPKGKNLKIENVNGDLDMEKLALRDLEISQVNGDAEFREISTRDFEFSNVNGDFDGERIYSEESIRLSLVNGSFEIREAKGKRLEISGVNGDIRLHENLEFERLEVEMVNGDIECRVSPKWLKGIVNLKTVSGDIEIEKVDIDRLPVAIRKGFKGEFKDSSQAKIFIETLSGKVNIR
ncbi:MAG: DUF4097 family beta strand repeat-containing protein [bacterium]|nr:DUF4097 family beta strand repeat-containing protein [bacterium]